MMRQIVSVLLYAALLAAGCSKAEPEAANDTSDAKPQAPQDPLLSPHTAEMKKEAPAEFMVEFETTRGTFVAKVFRRWAPYGADRFYNLVRHGYFNECRFFRVVPNFMAQIGIHGNPDVNRAWDGATIPDDPVRKGNTRGRLTFAKTGAPNSRSTQFYINFKDNSKLDGQGFASFGEIVEGMDVVDKLYSGYGEGAPRGRGPSQDRIQREGNAYLDRDFPELDSVKSARVLE